MRPLNIEIDKLTLMMVLVAPISSSMTPISPQPVQRLPHLIQYSTLIFISVVRCTPLNCVKNLIADIRFFR